MIITTLIKTISIFILTFCISLCYIITTVIFEIVNFFNKLLNFHFLDYLINYKSIIFFEFSFKYTFFINILILLIINNYIFIPFIFKIKNIFINFFKNIFNFMNYIVLNKNSDFYLKQYKNLISFNIKKILINTSFVILFITILFFVDFGIQLIEFQNLQKIELNYFKVLILILIIYSIIHLVLGLYMIYYDYLKNDAIILFIISIYIALILFFFLFIKLYANSNCNLDLNFYNVYLIENFINKKIDIFIFIK